MKKLGKILIAVVLIVVSAYVSLVAAWIALSAIRSINSGQWAKSLSATQVNTAPDVDLTKMWQLVNEERTKTGLQPLARDDRLNAAAQAKCNDMVAKDYWSHNAPDGTEPWKFITDAGVSYDTAGENLADGVRDERGTVTGWMDSPGHRANIMGKEYTIVGYAQCKYLDTSKQGHVTLIVQMFAKPYTGK